MSNKNKEQLSSNDLAQTNTTTNGSYSNFLKLSDQHLHYYKILQTFVDFMKGMDIDILSKEVFPDEVQGARIEITVKTATFLDIYQVITHLQFRVRRGKIVNCKMESFVTKWDLTPLMVKSRNTKSLLTKSMFKTNNFLRLGCFTVDPAGCIKFSISTQTNGQQLSLMNKKYLQGWFEFQYVTSVQTLRIHLPRVLRQGELLTHKEYIDSITIQTKNAQPRDQPKMMNKCITDYLLEIEQILKNHHTEALIRNRGEEELRKDELDLIQNQRNSNFAQVRIPNFHKKICENLTLYDVQYDGIISKGKHSELYLVYVTFQNDGESESTKKYSVLKLPARTGNLTQMPDKTYIQKYLFSEDEEIQSQLKDSPNLKRIQNEIQLIQHIASNQTFQKFHQIAKHWLQPGKDVIYMDHYLYTNFRYYQEINLRSLQSQSYWMRQMGNFYSMMETQHSVHLDLTPDNLLISKTFWIKVCDFSESICEKSKLSEFERTFTLPYSSPESLKYITKSMGISKNEINDAKSVTKLLKRSDVFSFAPLFFGYMTNKNIINFSRHQPQEIFKAYLDDSYSMVPIQDYFLELGPGYILKYLDLMFTLCVQSNHNLRLCPRDIFIISDRLYKLMDYGY